MYEVVGETLRTAHGGRFSGNCKKFRNIASAVTKNCNASHVKHAGFPMRNACKRIKLRKIDVVAFPNTLV